MTGLVHVLMMATALAQAPPALTLEQAIAEAMKAEPYLQAVRTEVDVARGDELQARQRPNPNLSFEEREQADGPDRQTSIAVDVPLDLFRRRPRIDAAGRAVERAGAMVRDRERLLAASVRERYGDVLAAARRLEVMDAVVAAARETLALLSNRVAEGAAPPLERDLAVVELRRLEGERSLEAGRARTARANLNLVLGRSPAASLTLADSLESLTAAPAAGESTAAPERADVQAASLDLEVARAQSRLARESGKPELSLFGGYMRMDAGFPQSGLSTAGTLEPIHMLSHNVAAGLRISLPIFDRARGTQAAAKARELAAAQTVTARRLEAAAEVAAATAREAAAREALTSYGGDTRALARRNVEVMRQTYVLGRATLLEVLAEQRRYLDFETAYTTALAEAFAAVSDVQRAKGELK